MYSEFDATNQESAGKHHDHGKDHGKGHGHGRGKCIGKYVEVGNKRGPVRKKTTASTKKTVIKM